MTITDRARIHPALHPRSAGRLLAAVLIGSTVILTTSGTLATQAQSDCSQPSETGCGLEFGQPVSAVLDNVSTPHLWRLEVSFLDPFEVALTSPAAELRVYVYGPGGSLLGLASNESNNKASIQIQPSERGVYVVFVDSPRGQVSSDPYALVAVQSAPSAGAPTATRPPAGTVLLSDDFNDSARGSLP